MHRDIHLQVDYPQPPESVWRVISESALVARWLMDNDLQLVVGRDFQFRTAPQPGWNGIVDCTLVEAAAPRRLAYTWRGSWGESLVRFALTPNDDGGTRLTLDHTGFTGLRGVMLSLILGAGWKKKLTGPVATIVAQL